MKGAYRGSHTIFQRIAALLAAALVCAALPVTAAGAEPLMNAVENAQYGIVRVVCLLDSSTASLGTGFAVGLTDESASIFVTNCHVIEDSPENVYVTITDFDGLIPAAVIYSDKTTDLALLRIDAPLTERHPLPLLSPTELVKSQDVFCLGFPGVADDFSDSAAGSSTINDITITKGSASNTQYRMEGVSCILTDAVINHGNSGGPMVEADGRVVGVNSWGIGEQMNVAVSIEYIMQAMTQLGLPYTQAGDGAPVQASPAEAEEVPGAEVPSTEVPGTEVPAASAAISDVAPASIAAPAENKRGGTEALLLGGGGALLVILICLAIFVPAAEKRKAAARAKIAVQPIAPAAPAEQRPPVAQAIPIPAQPAFAQRANGYLLVCEAGAIAGFGIAIDRPVRIGRDASACAVAFPPGTPGVSMRHCEVAPANGGVMLTDLGSSYGTFRAGGVRIAPHTPVFLHAGDAFFLASNETRFVIAKRPGSQS